MASNHPRSTPRVAALLPAGTTPRVVVLIAAYLSLFVGLIDSNAVNLALPAVLTGGVAELLAATVVALEYTGTGRSSEDAPTKEACHA